MKDSLGDRMKSHYEDRTRYSLARRSYTVIRADGKAFHTYCRGLERPFDEGFISDMDSTAAAMCSSIMGARLAYVQSDEISVVVSDFDEESTQAWFDNNLQKMCSVSASVATRAFNEARMQRWLKLMESDTFAQGEPLPLMKWGEFDSRVFQIPQRVEVENYLVWRQQDASRNSLSTLAQSLYSTKELHGKQTAELHDMCMAKGRNWNDLPWGQKRGRVVSRVPMNGPNGSVRYKWKAVETPVFTQDRDFLRALVPEQRV
jgi:tRNA(His) guanylyltransferase